MRFAVRAGRLFAWVLACVSLHLLSRLLTGTSRWPRRFLAGSARIVGMDVRIAGEPLRQDVFYVANHVSWVDILALAGATGCAFVSKDDVGRWPLIGWLAAQNGTIMVSRASRADVSAQVATIRAALTRHQPIALFPEGTTGDGHQLLPFKPSLFAVLLPPPRAIRIQPVVIDYGEARGDMGWAGDEGAFANVRRVMGRGGRTPVTLHFLEAFDPGAHPDRKAVAGEARARIVEKIRALRGDDAPV